MTEMVVLETSPLIGKSIKHGLSDLNVPELELFEIIRHKSLSILELPDDQTDDQSVIILQDLIIVDCSFETSITT
jgi:hypothetical protein